jgi:hypothetical protein
MNGEKEGSISLLATSFRDSHSNKYNVHDRYLMEQIIYIYKDLVITP